MTAKPLSADSEMNLYSSFSTTDQDNRERYSLRNQGDCILTGALATDSPAQAPLPEQQLSLEHLLIHKGKMLKLTLMPYHLKNLTQIYNRYK